MAVAQRHDATANASDSAHNSRPDLHHNPRDKLENGFVTGQAVVRRFVSLFLFVFFLFLRRVSVAVVDVVELHFYCFFYFLSIFCYRLFRRSLSKRSDLMTIAFSA